MRSGTPPTARRIVVAALVALVVGLGVISLAVGFSASGPVRLLQQLAVVAAAVVVIGGGAILLAQRMAGWREPASEAEFDAIVERSERLAREGVSGAGEDELEDWEDEDDDPGFDVHDEDDFEALVRSALDDLPLEFHRALEHVAVVVSDGGRRRRAYGLYHGDGVARDNFPDRIVVYRDTLLRDFGHDPGELRAQVMRTVRHELAHHLGWDEGGVRGLGL